MQPGVSLLSAEAADGSALHGSAGVGTEGASFDGGHAPPPHVGDQLVQGEWIEEERDGWSGEGGEQQVDAVERPGDWPASLKVRPSCPARRCCDPDAAPETDDN